MAGSRTLKLSILADVDDLNKKLKAANNDVQDSATKMEKFGKMAAAAFAAAAAAAGAYASKLAVDAVKAASDFAETQSKITVIFGESSKELNKFAETAAAKLGQSKTQALDAAATFAIFGKAAGLSGKALVDFSVDFVKLASDLASFNNTTPEDAIQAIGAALRGEAEPLRRYGVLLNDATLRAAALELGIYSGSGALTAQQKILAAQDIILKQTTLAQGDFARTSEGLANTQRILTAQFENTKIALGERLLPIVLDLVKFFQEYIPVAVKVLGNALKPIADAIDRNKESFQAFAELIQTYVLPVIGVAFVAALKVVSSVAAGVIDILGKVAGGITTVVNGAIAGINALIKAYNAIPLLPNIPTIPNVKAPTISVPKVSGSSATSNLPTIPTIPTPSTTTTGGGGGGASTAAKATSTATASLGITATSGFDPSRVRQGEAASMNSVTVNIGVAGDPEGVAREVINVINNSYIRGTGGARSLEIA